MVDSSEVNILVISDIHFGRPEKLHSGLIQKETVLKDLIGKLSSLEDEWKPTILAVTGDIGWTGTEPDYQAAEKWFRCLNEELKINFRNMIFCPGNHDIIRDNAKYFKVPTDFREADSLLDDVENLLKNYQIPFNEYILFQKRLEIPKLQIKVPIKKSDQNGEGRNFNNHLFGYRDIEGIRFIVLNTAWFSRDKGEGCYQEENDPITVSLLSTGRNSEV